MSATVLRAPEETVSSNPIDSAEEIAAANDWSYERSDEDELVCEIVGQYCSYRLFFAWKPQVEAMHVACLLDLRITDPKAASIHHLHGLANEKMWIGHFDLCSDSRSPMWRHTLLTRGLGGMAETAHLEEIIEAAVNECERIYPAYQFLLWGGRTPAEAVSAAVFETMGEA